jgi:hypothetical protein
VTGGRVETGLDTGRVTAVAEVVGGAVVVVLVVVVGAGGCIVRTCTAAARVCVARAAGSGR